MRQLYFFCYILIVFGGFASANESPSPSGSALIVNSMPEDLYAKGAFIEDISGLNLLETQHLYLIAEDGRVFTAKGNADNSIDYEQDNSSDTEVVLDKALAELSGQPYRTVRSGNTNPSSFWYINIKQSGDYCVSSNTAELWRPNARRTETLTVTHNKLPSKHKWSRGKPTYSFAFTNGAKYRMKLGSSPANNIVIHKIPTNIKHRVRRAGWMAEKRCRFQARALLLTASQ
ncbi:MAG: hypothetical protein AAF512_03395 [Pseudomonadota bacterium]